MPLETRTEDDKNITRKAKVPEQNTVAITSIIRDSSSCMYIRIDVTEYEVR